MHFMVYALLNLVLTPFDSFRTLCTTRELFSDLLRISGLKGPIFAGVFSVPAPLWMLLICPLPLLKPGAQPLGGVNEWERALK